MPREGVRGPLMLLLSVRLFLTSSIGSNEEAQFLGLASLRFTGKDYPTTDQLPVSRTSAWICRVLITTCKGVRTKKNK